MHADTHTHTHTHTCIHILALTHTNIHTHTHKHTHTRSHTHTHVPRAHTRTHTCIHTHTHTHTSPHTPEVRLSDLPEVVGFAQPLSKHSGVLGSKGEVDARHPIQDVVLRVKGGEVLARGPASLGPLGSAIGLGRCGAAVCRHRERERRATLVISTTIKQQVLYLHHITL